MTKDALDALASTVPEPIASGGARLGPGSTSPRPVDRRLGKQGVDLLARVSLFAGLNRRHLKQVAAVADEVSFRARETVVQQGMLGGAFFVILEGEAKVVRDGRTIATLRPGEFFGEISLLDGGPRTASVIADTPLACIRLQKPAFKKVLLREPGVGAKLLFEVARRLREMERPLLG